MPEVFGDLGHGFVPEPGELDGPLAELRWMWSWHVDILPRDDARRLMFGVRQTGGSSHKAHPFNVSPRCCSDFPHTSGRNRTENSQVGAPG